MRAVDTSVVIAAFATWHENHDAARAALDNGLELIEHRALETYSVLTRLPPPHRIASAVVRDFLEARFPHPFLRLSERLYRHFLFELPERGIVGGSAYDALVAATAADHNAELFTLDRRALPLYHRYGVKVQLLVS